jgi:hemerythrin superfamily protein
VVKELAEELAGMEPGADEWIAKVTVIMEMVEHHAEEEEREMFPQVRQALGDRALEGLGERLEDLKAGLGARLATSSRR